MAHSGKTITFGTDILPLEDNTYKLGDIGQRWKIYGDTQPIMSKTYTGVTVTGNSDPAGWLYFFKACCTGAYNDIWRLTYRVSAECAGQVDSKEISIVHIDGVRNTYLSYWVWNSIGNTSYYPYYAHAAYWRSANNTSVANEYAPILGLRFQSSYNPTNSTYARTVTFEILEMEKCQVTFFDAGTLYSAVPGTGDTYFASRSSFNGTTQGITTFGDRNDTACYEYTNGFKGQVGSNKIGRYSLFLKTGDGTYESLAQEVNTTGTTKTKNTHGFLPEGKIYYNANNTDYNAGTLNFSPYQQYHSIDYRYTFNIISTTLPDYCETYIKFTYNPSDGLLYLADEWLATALPSSADNYIYQRIGSKYYTGTSNYYQGSLLLDNPYYEYKDGSLHVWTIGSAYGNISISGTIGQTANWALANGDGLVVFDANNSNKIERSGITFDASTETQCLTKKGTWKTFGTSNLAIGTTSSTAMAGNTVVTNVNYSSTTAKAYLMASTDAPTSTATARAAKGDQYAYLVANISGGLSATQHYFNVTGTEKAYIEFNTTDQSLDFVFT